MLRSLPSVPPATHPRVAITIAAVRAAVACAVLLAAQLVLPRIVSAQFTDVTSGPLGNAGDARGVAWGDYDDDGDLDLYLSNYGQPNRLFRNDGGTFVDATSGPLGNSNLGEGVAWADHDNDGDLDLFLANQFVANSLFRNEGGGSFVDVAGISGPFLTDPMGIGFGVAWVDYDNDGLLDLLVANANQNTRLYHHVGGSFNLVVTGQLPSVPGWCAAFGDYDNDGDQDLYITTDTGKENKLFLNVGGTFGDATPPLLRNTGDSRGVAWGDYDNDGDLDLYLANRNTVNKLFRNDAGTFVDATSGPLGDPGQGYGVAWGDYDNDGDLDLFLANNDANRLFRNDGGGAFVNVASGGFATTTLGRGVAWGDYDNDGDLDLYLGRAGAPNILYRNEVGSANNWLQVKLVGTLSNRSAIGARVRVIAGGVSQMREISGGSGYLSQDALIASFGLGSETALTLVVNWPSGLETTYYPSVNQQITIEEPGGVDVPTGSDVVLASGLERTSPNPFSSDMRIDFALSRGGPVSVGIYSVTGQRVASVLDGAMPAGRHQLAWDGRDASGHPVRNGIYFVRMESPGLRAARRIVKLQ